MDKPVAKNAKMLENYFFSRIKNYCIENQRKTSEKSIRMYANRLRRALGLVRESLTLPFGLDWLEGTERINQVIEGSYSPSSRPGVLFSLWYIHDCLGKKESDTREVYYQLWRKSKDQYENRQKQCIKTEKQLKNWVEFPVLRKFIFDTYKVIRPRTRYKKGHEKFRQLGLLAAQVLFTRRSMDWTEMKIYRGDNLDLDPGFNYYVPKTQTLIFNNYKTKSYYKKQCFSKTVPPGLLKILDHCAKLFYDKTDNHWLFPHPSNLRKPKRYRKSTGKCLNRTIQEITQGFQKNLGIAILRTICATHFRSKNNGIEALDEILAHRMATSTRQLRENYFKCV